MSGVRLNTEKKLEHDSFNLKIGTTNKLNPAVVYVEGKAFISPEEERDDYSKDISEIKHGLRKSISAELEGTKAVEGKFILDFQVATNGIAVKKKSFMSFQFLLRQNTDTVRKLSEVKEESAPMIGRIADKLRDEITEHGFQIAKTKK